MRKTQSGFTIIELIVVIALLGILSAVALPRFINVTGEAHTAAVEGAGAGFATGIALLKAQTVADGNLGTASDTSNDGGALRVNTLGYAVGASGADASVDATDCVNIWTGLLQSNAPVASSAAGAGSGVDYLAAAASNTDCTYTYQQDVANARTVLYESDNGDVTVTVP